MNDIAIVSASCIFPGANDLKSYWDIIKNNKIQIDKISRNRNIINLNNSFEDIFSQSSLAGEIKYKVNENEGYRWQILCNRSLDNLIQFENFSYEKSSAVIMATSLPEESHDLISSKHFDKLFTENETEEQYACNLKLQYQSRYPVSEKINTGFAGNVLHEIQKKLDVNGPHYTIDSACSSSFAAINTAVNLLKNKNVRTCFVGALELNLHPSIYSAFSHMGALATSSENVFSNNNGLVLGEGIGFIALKKYEDAIDDGNTILAIIDDIQQVNNQKGKPVFTPCQKSQELVYGKVHGDDKRVDYIECHATGTKLGDETELKSIDSFWKNYHIPVGSVKSLIGHTRACSGMASFIKSILMIQKECIPSSPSWFDKDLEVGSYYFPIKDKKLPSSKRKVKIAISSFGFGGSNYHLLLTNQKSENNHKKLSYINSSIEKVLVDYNYISFKNYDTQIEGVPLSVLENIDSSQVVSLSYLKSKIKTIFKFSPSSIEKNISIISAGFIGTDLLEEISVKVVLNNYLTEVGYPPSKITKILSNFCNFTPDTCAGMLNACISGRAASVLGSRGSSIHVDQNMSSLGSVLENIEVFSSTPFTIVLNVIESIDDMEMSVKRKGLGIYLICNKRFAVENGIDYKYSYKVEVK